MLAFYFCVNHVNPANCLLFLYKFCDTMNGSLCNNSGICFYCCNTAMEIVEVEVWKESGKKEV